MDHADHVRLIRGGLDGRPGTWADLGSGGGAFTLALADLLPAGSRIFSVDRDSRALARQQREFERRLPEVDVVYTVADFTGGLELPALEGALMANSLHFLADKDPFLRGLRARLKPGGRLILVEYDSDRGNFWVPHPLSYPRWEQVAARAGFRATRELAGVPSRFLGRIYSALSLNPG